MADPVLGHIISGKVFDIYGNILEGATVTITHPTIKPVLTETTNSKGEYILNLNGLNTQWTVGDTITIKGTKSTEGTKSITTTIIEGGSQTQNITLAETSDFTILGTDDTKRHNLYFVIPTHYDTAKVTRERGLPVHNVLERFHTEQFTALPSDANKIEFHGWADPGSKTSEAKWRIQKASWSADFIIELNWASGTQNFDKVWNDRETYDYS